MTSSVFGTFLYHRSTDAFCKEPDSKYFRFCKTRQSRGQYVGTDVMKKQISTTFLLKKVKI